MSAPLDQLPDPPSRRVAVRVRPAALRQVRRRHPWVYDESILSAKPDDGPPGSLGVVFDDRREFVGIGLWDPASPLRLRMVHVGKPRTIDLEFWQQTIDAAIDHRRSIGTDTTAYRVVNGENDGLGGLIVDRYDALLVVKVYSPAWFPHLRTVVQVLLEALDVESVVIRLSRNVAALPAAERFELADGTVVVGHVDEEIAFRENGLRFSADVLRGQKTGHFLDQRDNRARVRDLVEEMRIDRDEVDVLDVFCCTGGFSVHAAAGGATHVHSVDLSPHAVEAAKRHMQQNPEAARADHLTTVGDAFEVLDELGQQGRTYDVVVVDPPSFASRQRDRDAAMRAYRKLAELAVPLVRPGGRLVQASCSAHVDADDLRATVEAALRSHGRRAHDVEITGHAVDHPVKFPEGRYLDAWFGALS